MTKEATVQCTIAVVGDVSLLPLLQSLKLDVGGLLAYTKKGFENCGEIGQTAFTSPEKYVYELASDTDDQKFLARIYKLHSELSKKFQCSPNMLCMTDENIRLLTRAAVCAHQLGMKMIIQSGTKISEIDSSAAGAIDVLRSFCKMFNSHSYGEALQTLTPLKQALNWSKGSTYLKFLEELCSAYFAWDERHYDQVARNLSDSLLTLTKNLEDFKTLPTDFSGRIKTNSVFVRKLQDTENVKSSMFLCLDGLMSAIRRYERGDLIVSLISFANSIEYALRSRMLVNGCSPERSSQINKILIKKKGEEGRKFLYGGKKISFVNGPEKVPSGNFDVSVKLGYSYKVGFIDMVSILLFLEDKFVISLGDSARKDGDYTLRWLNTMRNRVVHNMGGASQETVEAIYRFSQSVITTFFDSMKEDFPQFCGSAAQLPDLLAEGEHLKLSFEDFKASFLA